MLEHVNLMLEHVSLMLEHVNLMCAVAAFGEFRVTGYESIRANDVEVYVMFVSVTRPIGFVVLLTS
jgi:hypothetical protein